MSKMTPEEEQIVAWLRGEERDWFRIAYQTGLVKRVRISIQVWSSAKARGLSGFKAVCRVWDGSARHTAATYGLSARSIERGVHRPKSEEKQ